MEREDVQFDSHGARCAAWVYRPDGADDGAPVPCVVLAHGWTGVREQRLDAFAERFAEAGYGAVVFDYRHFGASEGEPRQLLSIGKQHEDWFAAIAFARQLPWVDADRIAAWGTSFSGGHVLWLGARDHRLAAVLSMVPAVDMLKNLPRLGPGTMAKLTLEGLKDAAAMARGGEPHYVASVGPPGSTAVMTSPDAEPGFQRLVPAGSSWPNKAAARIALVVGTYRPVTDVARIQAPVLYVLAADDVVTPADLAQGAADRTPNATVHVHEGAGHFDPYVEPLFDRVVEQQLAFLAQHVPVRAPATA